MQAGRQMFPEFFDHTFRGKNDPIGELKMI